MRVARGLFVVAVAIAAGACGSSDSTGPSDAFAGTYALKSINGGTLPYSAVMNSIPVTVNSGTLKLNADSTYLVDVDATATVYGLPGNYPLSSSGTYSRSGDALTFSLAIGTSMYAASGVVNHGTLTLTIGDSASPIQTMVLKHQ